MKKISRVITLLPACHNLEFFPTELRGSDAESLLATWTAAWHPELIALTRQRPQWCSTDQTMVDLTSEISSSDLPSLDDELEEDTSESMDDDFDDPSPSPPDDSPIQTYDGSPLTASSLAQFLQERQARDPSNSLADGRSQDIFEHGLPASEIWKDALILIPTVCNELLEDGFPAFAHQTSAGMVTGAASRLEIYERVSALTDGQLNVLPTDEAVSEMAEEFCALGYAWLQIQLLTRKIRYSSNLNQAAFDNRLVEAAVAFHDGNHDVAQDNLTACYDLLMEEKNNYYPIKPDLVDVVLTAQTTLGKSLERSLNPSTALSHKTNYYLTGDAIELVAEKSPAIADRLRAQLIDNTADLIGGSQIELPDPLLSKETTLNQIAISSHTAQAKLGRPVDVYFRRRSGLTGDLPGVLSALNFTGALHLTLDGSECPQGSAGTIRWGGPCETAIMAKTDRFLDANESGEFLDFAVQFGRQIDSAHCATMMLAHWPDRTCPAFHDLVRISHQSPLLGQFQTLTEHFDNIYDPGYDEHFLPDEYRPNYLQEAVAAKSVAPISAITTYWNHFLRLSAVRDTLTMTCLLSRFNQRPIDFYTANVAEIDEFQNAIERATFDWLPASQPIEEEISRLEQAVATRLSAALRTAPQRTDATDRETVSAIVNPLSFTRRITCTADEVASGPSQSNPQARDIVFTSASPFKMSAPAATATTAWSIDVASQSVCALLPSHDAVQTNESRVPDVQSDNRLRNEFFEATIDPKSGGLRSILFHGKRGNRAGQRIVFRSSSAPKLHSQMICETIDASNLSKVTGQIVTKGRIEMAGKTVATFSQTFCLSRGQRVVELGIDIHPTIELPDGAQTYFASQLAWQEEAATLKTSCQLARHPANAPQIHSPNFIEITASDYRLTLLTGGLPWHQRTERCKIDTLLLVGREQQRQFDLGIGIDVTHATRAAIDFGTPALMVRAVDVATIESGLPKMLHLNCKNIIATWSAPIIQDNQCTGVRLRLQETEGRSGRLNITTPWPVHAAHRQDLLGKNLESLIEDAESESTTPTCKASTTFGSHDFFQVEIRFSPR